MKLGGGVGGGVAGRCLVEGGEGRLAQKRKSQDFGCPEVGISGNFTDVCLVAGNNCRHTNNCKLSELKNLAALVKYKDNNCKADTT